MKYKYLINDLEKTPLAVVDALGEQLKELNMSKTTVHRHTREQCLFSLKQIRLINGNRRSDRVIELRMVGALKMDDFGRKPFFTDETSFSMHRIRPMAWSRKEEPAHVCVLVQKSITDDIWRNRSPRSGIPLCSTLVGQQETKDLWTMKCIYFKARWNEFLALLQFYFLSS